MTLRIVLSALISLSLLGCSIGSTPKNETLAGLNDRPLPLIADTTIAESEAKAIEKYRQSIDDAAATEYRPQALKRLADLLIEKVPEDDESEELENSELPAVLDYYQEWLDSYPDNENGAEVLYQMARAHAESGQPDKSAELLLTLNNEYPNSIYASESTFRLAEFYFSNEAYENSIAEYETLISTEDDTFYEPALYKQGWAYFSLAEYNLALGSFTRLLDERVPNGEEDFIALKRVDKERIDDTLRAMSYSFSNDNGVESVKRYFDVNGAKKYEDMVYTRLGDYYLEKERYEDSALTYATFIERNPYHPNASTYYNRVIDVYTKGRFEEQILTAKKQYVAKFKPDSEYWQYYPYEENDAVQKDLKKNINELANHYYAKQQKDTSDQASYQQASLWFQEYLTIFPEEETSSVHFLLAELHYSNKNYADAAAAYEATAFDYGEHDEAQKAAYSIFLSYQNILENNSVPEETAAWENKYVENAVKYDQFFPGDTRVNEVLAKAADIEFQRKKYTEAIALAEYTLTNRSNFNATQKQSLWTIVAHSKFETEAYDEAEIAYRQLLTDQALNTDVRANLTERLGASIYYQAEAAKEAGNLQTAATTFLKVREVLPGSDISATADYDAALAFMELKQWGSAASVLSTFRQTYPQNKLYGEATKNLAVSYQEDGQTAQAAQVYEEILLTEQDPEIRREAITLAADLYFKGGQEGRSINMLEQYVKEFPAPLEAALEARNKLAEYYLAQNNSAAAIDQYEAVVNAYRAAPGERTERAQTLAAVSSVKIADVARQQYESTSLTQPLKQSLAAKKELLEQALNRYNAAAEFGITEVTTESTYRSGELYADFGSSIMDSERPPNLDADTLEEYEILLEEQAIPFEDKSIEVHEINVQRLSENKDDEWVQKSLDSLKELMPARYAKPENTGGVITRVH